MNSSSIILKGYLFVLISASADATLPIIGKIAYNNAIYPANLLFLRNVFSFFLLSLYLIIHHKAVLSKSPLVLLQGLMIALQELFFYFYLQYLPASIATIIFYTYPIIVAVMAAFFFKEKNVPGFL